MVVFSCRRKLISEHFGEPWDIKDCKKMCDLCDKPKDICISELELFECQEAIIKSVANANKAAKRLTPAKVADELKATVKSLMKSSDIKLSPNEIKLLSENVVATLLLKNFLKQDFNFTPYKTISYVEPTELKVFKGTILRFTKVNDAEESLLGKRKQTGEIPSSKKLKATSSKFNFDDDL